MQWQLGSDWPVGSLVVGSVIIPAGTILTGVVGTDGGLAEPPKWQGQTLPMPMPIYAAALDEEAARLMLKWYPEELWHRLGFARSLDRDALLARARHRARWPRGH